MSPEAGAPGNPCPRCNGTGVLPDDRAIGAQMRNRRIAARMSLRALAQRLRLSAAYLSDLELGRRQWSALNINVSPKATEA